MHEPRIIRNLLPLIRVHAWGIPSIVVLGLLQSLSAFGFGTLEIKRDDFEAHDRVIQLGVSPNRIDLLTSISGVSFEEAWSTRLDAELDGIAVPFIGLAALIRNKEHTGRARDLGDAEELRKISISPK